MEKYFDKTTFTGLVLLLPSTMIIISILLRAVESELFYEALFTIKKTLNPYVVMNVCSLVSLLICFADIIFINSKKADTKELELLVYRKSFLNLTIITVNISYIIFIYLYHDLQKLGNIPVGRN
ncbi:MAG: hypothetical protein J0M37_16030 [Ignavibacteria bacterium]|nr:hypothetical protein [Ignavibacteria bacterium]